ncbi:hypothetical protein C8Q78DRAFT_1051475 [Trametes maxima]|nr:hypothetical protein C8Q78DRAFT_1051475 [Trametes maxima]
MSISTASVCSDRSCTTPSSSDSLRENQLDGWYGEIHGKVHTYGQSVEEYLAAFVPSRALCTLPDVDKQISDSWEPVKGKERVYYDPLVTILTELVSGFPAHKRPSFYNAHDQPFYFPFQELAHRHHSAKPDIAVSFPGETLPARINQPNWAPFAMVIEAKDVTSKDPFNKPNRGESKEREKTIIQLAVNARNLMFAHGFLAAFTIGIYGNVARIARFDRACAVASPPLDLKSAEGLKMLREFLWRFVHPWEGIRGSVVGCDTTIRKLTPADEEWLVGRLGEQATETLNGVDLNDGRCVKVWDEGKDGRSKTFMLFKLLDVNGRLFSRATMVWLGLEDTREETTVDCAHEVEKPAELCVVKDAWRQVIRTPEQKFYQRLKETIPEDEWIGLPQLLHGGDLGAREVRRWEAAREGMIWAGDDGPLVTCPTPFSAVPNFRKPAVVPLAVSTQDCASATLGNLGDGDNAPTDLAAPEASDHLEYLPLPTHQTWSCRLGLGAGFHFRERSHMRFVVNVVGRPLSRFRNTKELVLAIRDAIKGHRLAISLGGVLHKDVSSGNILIVDRPLPGVQQSYGVLHDYDYSAMTLAPPAKGFPIESVASLDFYPLESISGDQGDLSRKERTGTYYFMAVELIDKDILVHHDVNHDLESFYWVLIWIVLRHTSHNHPDGSLACDSVFSFGEDPFSLPKKQLFPSRRVPLEVIGNPPLTKLIAELNKHVRISHRFLDDPVPLTYDMVLSVFDEALNSDEWPSDDAALRFVLPALVTNGKRNTAKAKNKRLFFDEGAETGSSLNSETADLDPTTAGVSAKRPRKQGYDTSGVSGGKSWRSVALPRSSNAVDITGQASG